MATAIAVLTIVSAAATIQYVTVKTIIAIDRRMEERRKK